MNSPPFSHRLHTTGRRRPLFEIVELTDRHLRFAAALQARVLPQGFFVHLGSWWLRAYYRTFADSPHGVALVAVVADRPVGVLVGTTRNAAHYAWVLRRRGLRLAALGLLALVSRPQVAAYFLRTRASRYARRLLRGLRRRAAASPGGAAVTDVAVLTHLGVMETARGAGIGGALVQRFVAAAAAAGACEAVLVTKTNDAGAGGFYKRLGWTHVNDRPDHDGGMVSLFSRQLRPR